MADPAAGMPALVEEALAILQPHLITHSGYKADAPGTAEPGRAFTTSTVHV